MVKTTAIFFGLVALSCSRAVAQVDEYYAEDKSEIVEVSSDSVWTDSITGDRVHLQRLSACDTLVKMKPQPLIALAEDLGINAAILAWDYYVQDRSYARISKSVLEDHFKHGFEWDNDSFSGNQFAHPYHGAMFYNAAREHGLSYGVSLLYPIIGSATWEMLCETNAPAINDLLSTGVGGAAIGEVTHRTSDIFFDDSKTGVERVVREVIGSALNPVRAVHRLFSGEMWRVSRNRGKKVVPQPYSFDVSVGGRLMSEDANGENNDMLVPFVSFDFNYGERFTKSGKTRPFEFFSMSLLANLSGNHPSVGELDILGRIASKQLELKNDWNVDLGFYQTLKYVDHYGKNQQGTRNFAIISEAVSFGGGIYAERRARKSMINNDFLLNAVLLGGTNSDCMDKMSGLYYRGRRYNFGMGFSFHEKLEYSLNRKFTIGDDLYFMQLFTPSNYNPGTTFLDDEKRKGETNTMGDRGGHSIVYNTAYVKVNLMKNLRLGFEYTYYFRHSLYRYFPSVIARSQEYKIGLTYSI